MTEPSAAPRVIPSYDPAALYATDLREVFGRSWLFAAHDAELAGGGWLRREVGGRPIVITRDGERARAFFNVCPHRGARLVERDTGPCRAVACAWHGLS
ncbi:MAG TPA: Rieske 2Fe-2S domain-containing protein, partial [Myxococcota bacterium]|nr:Rieske 2Fe-2S domain-containing protein [Myxococcota bacterium]